MLKPARAEQQRRAHLVEDEAAHGCDSVADRLVVAALQHPCKKRPQSRVLEQLLCAQKKTSRLSDSKIGLRDASWSSPHSFMSDTRSDGTERP